MSRRALREFFRDDGAATLIEYSLLTGLISLTVLLSIAAISGTIAVTWSALVSMMAQVAGG